MFSGFADAGPAPDPTVQQMLMHYWFVESEGDPANDPVLVWYNGGPGASSLFGLLVELGPLLLNEDSLSGPEFNRTGVPQLQRNPYSWSKVASVLAVNNPPPVGFSYCTPPGPRGNGTSCGPWTDSAVATANHVFLANWIRQFPAFAKNKMYLAGESYAGVYVPTIAREIMNDPRGINLAGFAVGDGCMGLDILCGPGSGGPYYSIEFFYGHGQVSNSLYNQIRATCPETALRTGKNLSPACQALIANMNSALGGYFGYSLYDECIGRQAFAMPHLLDTTSGSVLAEALNDYPCPGPAMNLWLNRSDVRTALGVDPSANFFSGDNGVGFNYTLTEHNVLPIWQQALQRGMRVLAYNGDTDPGINSFVTQDKYFTFLDGIGMAQTQAWRPWTLDGKKQMGGYVVEYHQGAFAFLTIRGAGHMVPEYKGPAALAFLKHFLNGTDYPTYSPN